MKIGDVFAVANGRVTPKRQVTIVSGGGSATVGPNMSLNFASSIAGVSGQWIADHLQEEVPASWQVH